jgi:hypothetical protein
MSSSNALVLAAKEDLQIQTYMDKWIAVENQLSILQEKTKTMREWKKKLSEKIMEHMQHKNKSVQHTEQGEWKLHEKTEYSALSFSYVEDCLRELIPDEAQVDFVMDYLRDHREARTVVDVKYKKKNLSSTI